MVDNTLFTKKKSSNLIIVQIYVDDIIFGSTYQDMCDEFAKIMHDEFQMSMMGELNFFIGLQIKQMDDGRFFNQSKYIKEMLKKFGREDYKPMKTPMSSDTKLTKDEECESVDSTKYRSMIGACVFSDRWSLDELVYGALRKAHIKPTSLLRMISSHILENIKKSENLEGIMAQQEVVILLPPSPSINHPHLISTMMMMEIMKGPRMQVLFPSIDITTTPSLTTTYSSPTLPNAPSKTTSTNQISSSQENTSSSFHSKLQISPPSSYEPTPHHHLNPLLDNISDVPTRPLDPQPLQSHPSMDINLSISPITPMITNNISRVKYSKIL
uniref:Retrovirus-related Pol polyprotein from transposon TNT 1-94 n=1 Tax=Tanacetum cinerariifolium TaxID=118510 RepID=A0A6L2MCV6_TANCI|nr:retrovirus-related Pol polyprotein from transposon TNT 1-94 [Tanacetum cinerariifolium]